MKAGIVGVPNAGKSTFFNACMQEALAHAANYPFCTIEPNSGKVPVMDKRLEVLTQMATPQKTIEAVLECVDIAGLIKGASEGAGLGNAFLSNIRGVDLILQVVRGFNDPDTGEKPNIMHDAEIVEQELILADMQHLEKFIEKNKKDKKEEKALAWAKEALEVLGKEIRLVDHEFSNSDQKEWLIKQGMLTIKPYIYICNVNKEDLELEIAELADLRKRGKVMVCCATYEYELTQQQGDKEPSAIDQIIKAAYDLLGLISFFTVGEKEVRAWKVRKGSTCPKAAGVIHGDFEHGFIKAEIVSYNDFVNEGGWEQAKQKGKLRVEGKQYIMQDGDICFFKVRT